MQELGLKKPESIDESGKSMPENNGSKLNLQSFGQTIALAALIIGFFVVQDRRISRIEYNEEARQKEAQIVAPQRESDARKIESLTQQLQRLMIAFEDLIDETKLPQSKKDGLKRRVSANPMKLNSQSELHATDGGQPAPVRNDR